MDEEIKGENKEINQIKEPEQWPERFKLCRKRNSTGKKIWTSEDDILLVNLSKKYNNSLYKWKAISKHFPNRNFKQCYARFRMIDPTINKGQWTFEENERLTELSKSYGNNYSKISKIMVTRSAKQIRHHLLNVTLRNRNKFSEKEDEKLICLYLKHGSKWKFLSKEFSNRSPDQLKMR